MCEPQAGEAECEHKHTHMHIYTHIHLSYIHAHNRDILTKYTCTLVIHTNTTYAYKAHIQIHITHIDSQNKLVHIHTTYREIYRYMYHTYRYTHMRCRIWGSCYNVGLLRLFPDGT